MTDERGLRSVLQPALYLGVALLLHGMLFLIPGGMGGKPDSQTVRGVRVRTFVDAPAAQKPPVQPSPAVRSPAIPPVPAAVTASGAAVRSSGGGGGDESGPSGERGASQGPVVGSGGSAPPRSEFGDYLGRLRSEGVQGWAKESAVKSRQGWKGSGAGTGGFGTGKGGTGTGSGPGQGSGGGYLDPRVRMVVTSYPPTGIEKRYTQVPYPEIRLKKHQYTSGWWNVYIEIRTDSSGKITKYDILRPGTDGPMEKTFVEQVRREVSRWSFDPVDAEIHVDVRFYVE